MWEKGWGLNSYLSDSGGGFWVGTGEIWKDLEGIWEVWGNTGNVFMNKTHLKLIIEN